ncbi:hypothetical protein VM98_29600, partial [Streptomyces rubellomurinus subsp. indigoferus]
MCDRGRAPRRRPRPPRRPPRPGPYGPERHRSSAIRRARPPRPPGTPAFRPSRALHEPNIRWSH